MVEQGKLGLDKSISQQYNKSGLYDVNFNL